MEVSPFTDEMKFYILKNNPLLLEECEEWDFLNPPFDLVPFAESLVALIHEKGGLGVAANQCGFPYRIFAMRGTPENYVMVNPRIVNLSGDNIELEEACLSYPGLIVSKKRSQHCRVRFQGPDGETYTKQFTGMTARVVQHEMDHLNGKPFWSGISRIKFDIAIRKAYKRGYNVSNIYYKG